MDFRGAVLRGWRLLVLLAVVGAVIGYFSTPSNAAGSKGTGHNYQATALVGSTGKTSSKGSVATSAIYLDAKNPVVLTDAVKRSRLKITAAQLGAKVGIEPARQALGLPKQGRRGPSPQGHRHHRDVAVCGRRAGLANSLAAAIGAYLQSKSTLAFSSTVALLDSQVTKLQHQYDSITYQLSQEPTGSQLETVAERAARRHQPVARGHCPARQVATERPHQAFVRRPAGGRARTG